MNAARRFHGRLAAAVGPLFEEILSHLRSLARRFLIVTTVIISMLCGVAAVAFHRYLEITRELLIEPALDYDGVVGAMLVLLVPPAVFVVLALAIRRFAPRAVGANLARVRLAYHGDHEVIGPKPVLATFVATPVSLGAGAPLGPEGPIVVVTSGIASMVARVLRLPPALVQGMIPVGVAAGIAAVFNAPMTGVVFALEEIVGTARRGILGGILVGAVAAAVVERMLLGGRPILSAPYSTWHNAAEMIGFAAVGIIAGMASGLSVAAAHRLKRWWGVRMPSLVTRAATAGLLIGLAGLIAPETLGVGYESVSLWLHGGGTAQETAIAFAVKTVAFVIAISAGILGGTFAPSLFIGTALGAATGHTAHLLFPAANIDPKAYAIVGMGAVFAGLLRSPIAAVVIVVELTRDYELMVPVMLGVSLAVSISRRISKLSVVEQQMLDEGFVEGGEVADPLARVKAGAVMTRTVETLQADATIEEAARLAATFQHRLYPVVDGEMRLVGLVRRDAVLAAALDDRVHRRVREVMENAPVTGTESDGVLDLIRQMQLSGVDRCPVVAADGSRILVGFISPSDVLRVRMSQSGGDEPAEFEL